MDFSREDFSISKTGSASRAGPAGRIGGVDTPALAFNLGPIPAFFAALPGLMGPRIQRWDLNLGTGRSARSAQREVSRQFNVMPRTYPRPDLCGLIHTRVTSQFPVRPDPAFDGSDARFVSAKAGKIHRVTFCTSKPTSYYRKPYLHHSAKWPGCVRVSVARRYFFLRRSVACSC